MDEKICPSCLGEGWVLERKEGRTLARRCECAARRKQEFLWERARIPRRYQACSFKTFHPDPKQPTHKTALFHATKFVENFPHNNLGLLIIGSCGVGKTHIAVSIIKELIDKKRAYCVFYDFRDLIREIQNTFASETGGPTELEILQPVFDCDVLVLDELGAKRPTAWVEETIFYIINQRYNNKKLTIFTSNYKDTEDDNESDLTNKEENLVKRIGFRLRSRLYEMCWIVKMEGEDYRKKHKDDTSRY